MLLYVTYLRVAVQSPAAAAGGRHANLPSPLYVVHRVQPVISSYPPLSLRPDRALQVSFTRHWGEREEGTTVDRTAWLLREIETHDM